MRFPKADMRRAAPWLKEHPIRGRVACLLVTPVFPVAVIIWHGLEDFLSDPKAVVEVWGKFAKAVVLPWEVK